ncbi:hypothetical protein PPERSA_00298 [Pseudocohnilembus persalinus]|uniref:Tetratricopeptide repeat protein n=1 Tax=Pseudocohnilembus persalinus TaxID=266149 RepID=A0A0V0Q945_PSEPJ|nr:hypothetical protein PPERSA_00298 [Pseudocohnilembus persalinus]|eukprot:KRW98710.1 hypothetical protein PPERSA_00298 [Pseudocohnilembus persalinus]
MQSIKLNSCYQKQKKEQNDQNKQTLLTHYASQLQELGNVYLFLNKLEESLEIYQLAQKQYQIIDPEGNSKQYLQLMEIMSSIYIDMNQVEQGQKQMEIIMQKIGPQPQNPELIELYLRIAFNMSKLYYNANLIEESENYAKKLLQVKNKDKYIPLEAQLQIYEFITQLMITKQDYQQAQQFINILNEYINLADAQESDYQALSHLYQGHIYLNNDDKIKAIEQLQKSAIVAEKVMGKENDVYIEASITMGLTQIGHGMDQKDSNSVQQGVNGLLELIDIVKTQVQFVFQQSRIYQILAAGYNYLGETEKALQMLENYKNSKFEMFELLEQEGQQVEEQKKEILEYVESQKQLFQQQANDKKQN